MIFQQSVAGVRTRSRGFRSRSKGDLSRQDLSRRNVRGWCPPRKGGAFRWEQTPPGNYRSSRSWRDIQHEEGAASSLMTRKALADSLRDDFEPRRVENLAAISSIRLESALGASGLQSRYSKGGKGGLPQFSAAGSAGVKCIERREAFFALEEAGKLLSQARVASARKRLNEAVRKFPANRDLADLLKVVSPGRVESRDERFRYLDEDVAWLKRNRASYSGQWVALLGGELLAAADTLRDVLASLRERDELEEPPLIQKVE